MKETVKDFYQLSLDELFEIYRLRVSVFVVEQNCPYQEVDETDREALHIFLRDDEGIAAYCRLFRQGEGSARVGRVIAVRRRQGLGSRVVSLAMDTARARLGAKRMVVEAQCYAAPMYEKLGFTALGEEFLDDGIPHIRMEREL